jgi:hypothetical protein
MRVKWKLCSQTIERVLQRAVGADHGPAFEETTRRRRETAADRTAT